MLYDLENKNLQNWVNNFDEKTKNESAEAFNTYYKMKLQMLLRKLLMMMLKL